MTEAGSSTTSPTDASRRREEDETLAIMDQFRTFYQGKLREIDRLAGGDCTKAKMQVQEKWIEDLTEQTRMLAKAIKDLEKEAKDRVQKLEDQLKKNASTASEVMKRYQTYDFSHCSDESFQKDFYFENDLKNLLEFIRRVREDRRWSIDGLQFYEVTHEDLFGKEGDAEIMPYNPDGEGSMGTTLRMTMEILEDPNDGMPKSGQNGDFGLNMNVEDVKKLLKTKELEYDNLKRSMVDMRAALTEEVACKYDLISSLRKELQQMQERCIQADKQTAFKDDIIKELRKEIKQYQSQEAKKLKCDNDCLRQATCRPAGVCAATMANDEDALRAEICQGQCQIKSLKCKCEELSKALCSAEDRAKNLQNAVDLYLNSINVLEASEEKAKIEVEQQRVTINNLQEALVVVKQELDDYRQQHQQEVSLGWAARWFGAAASAPPHKPGISKSVHDV